MKSQPEEGKGRVQATHTNPPPDPGHADTLRPSQERVDAQKEDREIPDPAADDGVGSQEEMLQNPRPKIEVEGAAPAESPSEDEEEHDFDDSADEFEPKPPKVLMNDPKDTPLELRSQIQIYATTE